jgi:hypothetical protein
MTWNHDMQGVSLAVGKCKKGHWLMHSAHIMSLQGIMRFLPQRRKVVATPHEVALAAKYIVDRWVLSETGDVLLTPQ